MSKALAYHGCEDCEYFTPSGKRPPPGFCGLAGAPVVKYLLYTACAYFKARSEEEKAKK